MSLQLHSEKGVNPRLSCCIDCGEAVGVVLLGVHDNIWTCPECRGAHIQAGRPFECKSCGKRPAPERWESRRIEEWDHLPIELCATCKEKRDAARRVVEEGGIYWKCTDCGSNGAIYKHAPIVAEVRERLNTPTGPCGLEFTQADCPVCSDDAKKKEGE